jgi:hypothetical protein
MHDYIRFFRRRKYGHWTSVEVEVEAKRDSCLSLIRYAKRIKRTGQALIKD